MLFVFLLACDQEQPVPDPTPLSLETPFYFGDYTIPASNALTIEGVNLGRKLFYEKKLSGDNTMSCATCHDQATAFASLQRFHPGINGDAVDVNTPSLANLMWFNRMFWNGREASIEDAALNAIENPREMDARIPDVLQKLTEAGYDGDFQRAFGSGVNEDGMRKALSQFMRTLITAESKYDQYLRGELSLNEQELRGEQLFFTHPDPVAGIRGGNCGDCHTNFLTNGFRTNFDGFHNNGLDSDGSLREGLAAITGNEQDMGKFRTPTLRNIALTPPYMHDGRFNTLEEVLDHYNEHIQPSSTLDVLIQEASNDAALQGTGRLGLTKQEKEDIIAFLNTLTDETFTTDSRFSDPF